MDDPVAKATEFYEGVKGLTLEDLQSFANEALQSEIDKYNSGSARERQYNYAKAGTGLVWLLIGAKKAIDGLVDAVKGLLGNWRRFVKQFPKDTKTYLGTLSQELKNQFKVDFSGAGEAVKRRFTEGMVRAWEVLFKEGDAISQALRTDPTNLEKLSRYIEVEGVDIAKLKSSFANTKDAQKWIDLKLPKSDLDNIYAGFKNDPPFNHTPWTPEHKAQRWKNYEEGCANGQNACLDFESWSNGYDGKIDLVTNANKGVDDYFNSLGWNCPASTCRERTLSTTVDGQTVNRRLDIYDEVNLRGKEFKEYSSGKVYRSPDIGSEVARDKQLLEDGQLLEMEWVFKGCEPSGPLKTLLESSPNPITIVLIP